MDSDEEINRYKDYLVEKITSQDGHVVVEIRPWEAPQAEACSHESWYQEHINHLAGHRISFNPDQNSRRYGYVQIFFEKIDGYSHIGHCNHSLGTSDAHRHDRY